MIVASGAKHALEIGGANGYSAIWIGLGLRETGGRLTSDRVRSARARRSPPTTSAKPGSSDIVTMVSGDAFAAIRRSQASSTSCFSTRGSATTSVFSITVMPRLRPHGLFLAHNVVNKQAEMRDFLAAIRSDPRLLTTIVEPSDEGMSISYKVR